MSTFACDVSNVSTQTKPRRTGQNYNIASVNFFQIKSYDSIPLKDKTIFLKININN